MWLMVVSRSRAWWSSSPFLQRAPYVTLVAIGFLYNLGSGQTNSCSGFFHPPRSPSSASCAPRSSTTCRCSCPTFPSFPGMAVFLVRIETDFVEYYDKFYDAVRSGGSLEYIENMRDEMVFAISRAWARSPKSRPWPCWSPSSPFAPLDFGHLAPVPAAAACAGGQDQSCRSSLMAVLNVFFYLDQRRAIVVGLCASSCCSTCSHRLHPALPGAACGYGFALQYAVHAGRPAGPADRRLHQLARIPDFH